MWSSFVVGIVLSACFFAHSSQSSTTNVYVSRERPLIYDRLDVVTSTRQEQRQLSSSGVSYFQNTYNPQHQPAIDSKLESLDKSIPWGAINIVVVTDVHSWIAGNHKDDPRHWPYDAHRATNQDADYGHVLSFYQRLQDLVQHHNAHHENPRDLWFVMNGDFVDGTGFSGYPPVHLGPILQHMPWDAINVGNHELYHDETIQYIIDEQQQQLEHKTTNSTHRWNQKGYLSSNTVLKHNHNKPMTGNKYAYLQGKHTNTTILAFGFLYDFDEGGSLTEHVNVQDTLQEEWFQNVLNSDKFDAILVLAHMDCLHPLIDGLLEGIRSALPEHHKATMPIQFVTGHTHRRCHSKLDPQAESFEAGRFLDTIGFVSLDTSSTSSQSTVFQHRFWDANLEAMHEILVHEHANVGYKNPETNMPSSYTLGFVEDFGTLEGRALTQTIQRTQSSLGLDELLGCAPQTYGLFEEAAEEISTTTTKPKQHKDATLWDLYLRQMLPKQLLEPIHRENSSREPIFVSGTGILRYSIFEGPVTINDIIAISPFNDTIHELVAFDNETSRNKGSTSSLPIYGRELLELFDFANDYYASAAEYGLSTFVLSTLSSSPAAVTIEDAHQTIEPHKVYRILATDYDAYRLLTAIAGANESPTEHSFFATEKVYQSQLVSPNKKDNGSNEEDDCHYLTELWNDFIRNTMPCQKNSNSNNKIVKDDQLSLRWGRTNSLLSASTQILQPPSAASASVHSRMTPAQEDRVLASDQMAAALLVVFAVAMTVYLMTHSPGQRKVSGRRNHPGTMHIETTNSSILDPEHHDAASLQLIPLRRYNTGNLSEGSYGSI